MAHLGPLKRSSSGLRVRCQLGLGCDLWLGQGEGPCSGRCWEKSLPGSYRAHGSCCQSQQQKERISSQPILGAFRETFLLKCDHRKTSCYFHHFLSVGANCDNKGDETRRAWTPEDGVRDIDLRSVIGQNEEDCWEEFPWELKF